MVSRGAEPRSLDEASPRAQWLGLRMGSIQGAPTGMTRGGGPSDAAAPPGHLFRPRE
jgi:hypothetical protein